MEIYAPLMRRWLRTYEVQEADADDFFGRTDVIAALVERASVEGGGGR